ncbi:MAG TPA: RsfA family transcriptional regulator [Bacillus sp. (in: firmicutes)]|uniref:RsfA family transcriptional regulator n=1 Tax=Bacillus litorisediminis TaxID=2922713 RepID=UPI001FAE428F|nr:RsfA family transcriptional regulator [Bacillus litorisediminis]HWO77002.1 RsfA family transcriptional regulator [Bacillus sp. (in: firmicutes)]
MKTRQDAWTDENDLLLAETVLRHVREGSTQLNAFEEVGDKLNRTSAACGFRWNAVVRHRYEKALQLAKKQRKQRQRLLGKEHAGKKKLLYQPPSPSLEFLESDTITYSAEQGEVQAPVLEEVSQELQPQAAQSVSTAHSYQVKPGTVNLDTVIQYLQGLRATNFQSEILKNENERLKRELADLRKQNEELERRVKELEQDSTTMQEDYETLMKIMNRARKFVAFEEDDRPSTKFKMDRNGNLEKLAE